MVSRESVDQNPSPGHSVSGLSFRHLSQSLRRPSVRKRGSQIIDVVNIGTMPVTDFEHTVCPSQLLAGGGNRRLFIVWVDKVQLVFIVIGVSATTPACSSGFGLISESDAIWYHHAFGVSR